MALCVRFMPMLARRVASPAAQQTRTLFYDPWSRSSDIRALMRDMDRQMARLERDMFRGFPSMLPRLVPVANPSEGQYRVGVDLSDFAPEEIDISLDESGRKLTIKAQCQRTGKDGSKLSKEVTRVLSLPENIDPSQLKSVLHHNGYLAVEAPLKEQPEEEPKLIPISRRAADQTQHQEISSSSTASAAN